jgi:hypothetical protein
MIIVIRTKWGLYIGLDAGLAVRSNGDIPLQEHYHPD